MTEEEIDNEIATIREDLALAKKRLIHVLEERNTRISADLASLRRDEAPFYSVSGRLWSAEGWEIQHYWTEVETLRRYLRRWELYKERKKGL